MTTSSMLDPELEKILLAAGKAAASAVGGMVVRSSTKMWKEAYRKYRPAPSRLRRAASWKNVRFAEKQAADVHRFLEGRKCQGLLEMLAYIYYQGEKSQIIQREAAEVKAIFFHEIRRSLRSESDDSETARRLWTMLNAAVRLHVSSLKRNGAFTSEDALLYSRLSAKSGDAKSSRLPHFISDRSSVADSQERSARAVAVINAIRAATAKSYETILMPQVRDDHQIPIQEIYIQRTFRHRSTESITRRSEGIIEAEDDQEVDENIDSAAIDRRVAIIGNPGAGKSTFVRHLMFSMSIDKDQVDPAAPMIVELKNHAGIHEPWVDILAKRMSVVTQESVEVQTVQDILSLGTATVVFDGLDEVNSLEQRRQVVRTIQQFAFRYPLVRIIVTSREEGFLGARLDSTMFPVYYLPDFTEEQVRLYANKWFTLVNKLTLFDPEERARNFLRDSEHVRDLRANPLLLALLCAIYDYDGYIPENRPSIYQQCADLLLERWDRQRGVHVSFKTTMEIRYLIQELAYHFFSRQSIQSGETELGLKALIRDYVERQVTGDRSLAQVHAEEFLDYCAGRAWVLSRVGRNDRGERLFGFTHRTFMEYFSACYLVRHHTTIDDLIRRLMPMIESGSSDVVPQIAIQELNIRMADAIDDCFSLIVFGSRTVRRTVSKAGLRFVVRSLVFMRPTPRVLKGIFESAIEKFSVKWDIDLLATLLQTPGPARRQLLSVCEDIFHRTEVVDKSSARSAASSAIVATFIRTARSVRASSSGDLFLHVPDVVKSEYFEELRICLDGQFAVAQEAFLIGCLDYSTFAEMVPPHVLFAGPELPSMRGVFYEMLLDKRSGLLYGHDLEKMRRILVRSPLAVFPLTQGVVHELLSAADRWAISTDSPATVEDKANYLLAVAVSCACSEWDWDLSGTPSPISQKVSDTEDLRRLVQSLRTESLIPVPWRKVFKMWLQGSFRFGVSV